MCLKKPDASGIDLNFIEIYQQFAIGHIISTHIQPTMTHIFL